MRSAIHHIRTTKNIMGDKDHKFLFFPNRKAGTQSVCYHALKDRCIQRRKSPNTFRAIMKNYSDDDIYRMFKFTIVRNPWERVVSAFHALQQYSTVPGKVINKGSHNKIPIGMEFDEFIIDILAKEGPMYDTHFHEQHINFYYQDTFFVNYIARMETIGVHWGYIGKIIDAPIQLPHKNKSKHKHYREYYNEETKDIVECIYRKDIHLLFYSF